MKKVRIILNVVVFCLLIASLSIIFVVTPDAEISTSERRPLMSFDEVLNPKPDRDDEVHPFDVVESYFLDQFPFRDAFRRLKAVVYLDVFRKNDNNGIYKYDGTVIEIQDTLEEDKVNAALDVFNDVIDAYFKENDIYYSIIPDKHYYASKQNGYPALDYEKMIEIVKSGFGNKAEYIDITELLSLSDYYTTDSHWSQEKILGVAEHLVLTMNPKANAGFDTQWEIKTLSPFYGVYYGQSALSLAPDDIVYLTNDVLDSMTASVVTPAIDAKTKKWTVGTVEEYPVYVTEMFSNKDPYDVFLAGPKELVVIDNPKAENDKELVIFRDSFGSSISPLIALGYKKVTLVDLRYALPDVVEGCVDFDEDTDVLFLYSTGMYNSGSTIKKMQNLPSVPSSVVSQNKPEEKPESVDSEQEEVQDDLQEEILEEDSEISDEADVDEKDSVSEEADDVLNSEEEETESETDNKSEEATESDDETDSEDKTDEKSEETETQEKPEEITPEAKPEESEPEEKPEEVKPEVKPEEPKPEVKPEEPEPEVQPEESNPEVVPEEPKPEEKKSQELGGGMYLFDGYAYEKSSYDSSQAGYAADVINKIIAKYASQNNVYISIIPDKSYGVKKITNEDVSSFDSVTSLVTGKVTGARYIDISALLDLSDYYFNDSHWRQECIVDVASRLITVMNPSAQALSISNYNQVPLSGFDGAYAKSANALLESEEIKYLTNSAILGMKASALNMAGKYADLEIYSEARLGNAEEFDLFLGGAQTIITIENPTATSDKELIIFRDSFGASIAPLLAEGYKKVTCIDIRYIVPDLISNFVDFSNADVLFLYSEDLLNSGRILKDFMR